MNFLNKWFAGANLMSLMWCLASMEEAENLMLYFVVALLNICILGINAYYAGYMYNTKPYFERMEEEYE